MNSKYYSKTNLSKFTFDELIEIGSQMFDFCADTLGVNFRKPEYPSLSINTSNFESAYAQYNPDDNIITIYIKNVKNLGQLTSAYIHEYTHYLQPCKTKYRKLLKEFGYDSHPFEIEARQNEKLHNRNLLLHLRKNITK